MLAARSRRLATLGIVVAVLVASTFVLLASSASADAGCFKYGGSGMACSAPGGPGDASRPTAPPQEGGGATGPQVCSFDGREVPCTTAAGTWQGRCYEMPVPTQPPFSSPIWGGSTTGIIVTCTPPRCLSAQGEVIAGCVGAPYRVETAVTATIDEAAIARRAIAQLDIDPVTLGMAPRPNLADPNVLIGAPAYFWAEGGPPAIGPLSTTVTEQGITITLNATVDTVTYDTGDGATLTCTRDQVATAPTNMTLQGTPDCGHRWESSGTYTLTATSNWTITWQGPTQNGTFDYTLDNAIDVAVTDRPVNLTTNKDY